MNEIKNKLPGVTLIFIIAMLAWILGGFFPVIGSPVLGILLGMVIAFYKRPEKLEIGIAFTSKKLLQVAIILLGFNMNLFSVFEVGSQTIILMVFTFAATFLSAYIFGKILKVDSNTNILIGVGTAICGGSAIAATAPVIGANDEDIARSISTIFLFNILAAFLFPILGHLLHLSDYNYGLWAGTAVNDTSSVVAAGYTFSNAAGDMAVIVKLTRTLMIVPITVILAIYSSRKKVQGKGEYNILKVFPWFVIGFVIASIISTLVSLPFGIGIILSKSGKFLIVMAMVAIGLKTNIVKLINNGWKPILLGFGCWFILSITSLIAQYVGHM